jgi:membrane protein YqaA with SNARE-associated domain
VAESEQPERIAPSSAPVGGLLGLLLWPFRFLKTLYAWVLSWAESKYGTAALFCLSFAEASFFPIPPDPLLLALCFGKRRKSLWFGLVCTTASVLGGIAGWYIGRELFESVAVPVIERMGWTASWFGTPEGVDTSRSLHAGGVTLYENGLFFLVKQKFDDNAFWAYFTAALTPVPYKVFTIAGGVFEVSLTSLIFGSIAGRGSRMMSVAAMAYFFGDRIKPFIEKYFEWLTVGFCLLGIAGFVAAKYMM